MDRPIRPGGRRVAALAVIVFLAAACGSSSTPTSASSGGASSPGSSALSASGPVSTSSDAPSVAPGVSAPATPATSVSGTGAVAQPSGTPCDWLDKATIDASLGLSVGAAIPNTGDAKGKICTWLSTTPQGGITLAIVTQQEVDTLLAHYAALPGGQLVTGLGVKAGALFLTGQKAPLPKSHAQVFVDFGGWALSVDVSGPAVTVAEAAALATAAVTH